MRSLKDQALEQYLATEQAQRSVRISLVSQVAAAYLSLAADRERLALARETLASQQSSYELTRVRFEAGVSSALDLYQARTVLDAARVEIARYTGLVAQDENALALVVGSPVPAELLPQALSENAHRPEGASRPACRPRCCCAGPTSCRPRAGSRGPTPTSARRGRRSSPGSR